MLLNAEISRRIKEKKINTKQWIQLFIFFNIILVDVLIFQRIYLFLIDDILNKQDFFLIESLLKLMLLYWLITASIRYGLFNIGFKFLDTLKIEYKNIRYGLKYGLKLHLYFYIYIISTYILSFISCAILGVLWADFCIYLLKILSFSNIFEFDILFFFLIDSYFFAMRYIFFENPNLNLWSILKKNNLLLKNNYKRVLSCRFIIAKILIVIFLFEHTQIINNKLACIAYFLSFPLFIMKEIELYKILKEEAIEKGSSQAEEFLNQQS